MRLIIHATNIHQGGGLTLLNALISEIKQPAILLLDSRLKSTPNTSDKMTIFRVAPNIFTRLFAEFKLKKLSRKEDIVLCFGNLPPLFNHNCKVFVYLQNRYLCSKESLKHFSWKIRLRIIIERLWLKHLLRSSCILVQSETMKAHVKNYLGYSAIVLPFMTNELNMNSNSATEVMFDFLYVASGEPHKNHKNLIQAWIILANYGYYPSLCLTLDPNLNSNLLDELEKAVGEHNLNIFNHYMPYSDISNLYQKSRALIYPSYFESFGLPLLEAKGLNLPIIASEKDYVRDIVEPNYTFDPESPISITRAVMRHLGITHNQTKILNPASFLNELVSIN